MTDAGANALLPDGLRDALPPDAAHQADIVGRLVACFGRSGYDRVTPPLVEFEDTLLDGAARAIANATFRLMDPVSQRMMGVRADMTLQVARIATTRLTNAPRPLRLAYAGSVLRVRGSQLRPEREFYQAGAELIGASDPAADAEAIALAASALDEVGVAGVSVDIHLPTLVPALCQALGFDEATVTRLRAALDRKDAAAVAALKGAQLFAGLLDATGPAEAALNVLATLDLPQCVCGERDNLAAVAALLADMLPGVMITVDPVEHRGFEYHSGLSFTLFARGVRGELGRGGRYLAGQGREPATGFTLFLDSILRAAPPPPAIRRIFMPHGAPPRTIAALRGKGRVVVAGLAPVADDAAEARRLSCCDIFIEGRIVALDSNEGHRQE
jgi:ATP phosphoribosyltransferase regulatory subunit